MMISLSCFSQDINGVWEWRYKNGIRKNHILVYERDGALYGRVMKTFSTEGVEIDKVCYQCPGEFNDKSITGLTILKGAKRSKDKFQGDKVLFQPDLKKWYDCKIWLDGDVLKIKAYEGILSRTQTLYRVQ